LYDLDSPHVTLSGVEVLEGTGDVIEFKLNDLVNNVQHFSYL
jgi:hypothetical protein